MVVVENGLATVVVAVPADVVTHSYVMLHTVDACVLPTTTVQSSVSDVAVPC